MYMFNNARCYIVQHAFVVGGIFTSRDSICRVGSGMTVLRYMMAGVCS